MASAAVDAPSTSQLHNGSSSGAASAEDVQAARLKALQEQIAARKRKRESAASEDVKGKGRAVTFSEVELDSGTGAAPASDAAAAAAPVSILKPVLRTSQEDAFRDAKASVPKAPEKKKTVAKKRYLKAKLERRKAKKRADKDPSADGADSEAQGSDDAGEGNASVDAAAAVEQRKLAKRAKRDERNARKRGELPAVEEGVMTDSAPGPEQADDTTMVDKEARKTQRKAKKEAKRSALAAGETSMNADASSLMDLDGLISTEPGSAELLLQSEPLVVAEPLSRRELKQQALLEEAKAIQDKANKKAAKAARKAKFASEALGHAVGEQAAGKEEELPPTQKDSLPRFPAPVKPTAPSQRELDDLAISSELRYAVVVDQSRAVALPDYQESSSLAAKLSASTLERLREMQIESLFAVQAAVLPILLENRKLYSPRSPSRDLCVSAPTGSGKTLGYVIPMVEILGKRTITRLRGLVVLPTRDLVHQVREVFEQFSHGTGLRIGTATGQHSFSHEQSTLVDESEADLLGGSSRVDILIATPGRLMDHLKATPGFTLQHLRFLVIDEADRLLNQSFNDWLKTVLNHIERTSVREHDLDEEDDQSSANRRNSRADAVAPALMESSFACMRTDLDAKLRGSTQKLLFSATLTRDPARVAALRLNKPVYLAVTEPRSKQARPESVTMNGILADAEMADATVVDGGDASDDEDEQDLLDAERRFALPSTLSESMIVTSPASKPLILLHLLYTLSLQKTLAFTKSVESAARLVSLLEFFSAEYAKTTTLAGDARTITAANYSSDLTPGKRREVIERFKSGEVQVLVCSDLVARGMDISGVEHVINYDVPVDMRKYVHRVGRTARAGKAGQAWSLVEKQEASYFKNLLRDAGRFDKVKKIKVAERETEKFEEAYGDALDKLRDAYSKQ